jgi:hypothetical protein
LTPSLSCRQRQRVGADQHAHDQVAQHRRQLQGTAHHHAQHGGQQVEQDEFEVIDAKVEGGS